MIPDSVTVAATDTPVALAAVRQAVRTARVMAAQGPVASLADGTCLEIPGFPPDRANERTPVLEVRYISVADSRDALDDGVDVLVTRDPVVLAYAVSRSEGVSLPLPWDRLYVLVAPNSERTAPTAEGDSLVAAVRAGLAADVVRAEARPITRGGWDTLSACALRTTILPGGRDTAQRTVTPTSVSRVVFPAHDEVARALAERLVALAALADGELSRIAPELTSPTSVARATGLEAAEWRRAVAGGGETAYIIPVRPVECATEQSDPDGRPTLIQPTGDRVLPLVETRARAIIRRARGGSSTAARESAAPESP